MHIVSRLLTGLTLLAFSGLLLLRPEVSKAAMADGLRLCGSAVLPSLFPFFVLSRLWIDLRYAERLSNRLSAVLRHGFHLSSNAGIPLVLGALGGYPLGALTTAELYEAGALSRRDACSCLFFCCNGGPAFLVGFAGGAVFHSVPLGLLLWAVHLTAALLLGLLVRPAAIPMPADKRPKASVPPLSEALTTAIAEGGQTALSVCSFLLFFSVLTAHLQAVLPETRLSALLLSSLELTSGIRRIASLGLPLSLELPLAAALLGWGGFCVHCQSLCAISKTDLPCSIYLLGKLAHSLLSGALACALVLLKDRIVGRVVYPFLFFIPALLLLRRLKTASGKKPQIPL